MIVSNLLPRIFASLIIFTIGVEVSKSDIVKSSLNSPQPETSFYVRQLQLLKIYNNLNCWRDNDVQDISNTYNPLDNLDLYDSPKEVDDYFGELQSGRGLPRDSPFINNLANTEELIRVFRVHFLAKDWETFYKTAAYSLARVNVGMFFWALSALVTSKYANEFYRTPAYYEVFPQLFAPKGLLYSLNGIQQPPSNISNGVEDRLVYFKDDPLLNDFHFGWHTDFPFWWNNAEYKIQKDRKGELFLYMHRQLVNRYRAERISVGLRDFTPIKLKENLGVGYVPGVLNINFKEITPRLNNSRLGDTPTETVDELQAYGTKVQEGILRGYFVTVNGTRVPLGSNRGYDIVGATLESSADSVSQPIYGSFHNRVHRFVSRVADPDSSLMLLPGMMALPEGSIRDPCFFRIHSLVDNFYVDQSRNLNPYTEADLRMSGIDLTSFNILTDRKTSPSTEMQHTQTSLSILETYLEDFSFDVSNGLKSCNTSDSKKYVSTMKRHNHKAFNYYMKVFSHKKGKVNSTVRIFMSPTKGFDGKPYHQEKLYRNMIEMDRFTVTLTRGLNKIIRSSKDSAVSVPDATSFEQLMRETREAIEKGLGRPDTGKGVKHARHCGYPAHLLVPKGTRAGMQYTMFVILTEGEELLNYPGVPLCGVETGMYPDRKPMGFPFERKLKIRHTLPSVIPHNYKFTDVVVKHMG